MKKKAMVTLCLALCLGLLSLPGVSLARLLDPGDDIWTTRRPHGEGKEIQAPATLSGFATDRAIFVGSRILVPIIGKDGWVTSVNVQNVGNAPTNVVIDLYAASNGQCPPQNTGILKTECYGPLKPGISCTFSLKDEDDAQSAIVYAVVPGTEDVACGGDGSRQPGEPLAVTVQRTQTAPGPYEDYRSSSYTGISDRMLGGLDPTTGTYQYYVPCVFQDAGSYLWNTTIWIQNGGGQCTSIEVWYQEAGDCEEWKMVQITGLAPGESVKAPPPPWAGIGLAWIRSSQPLGIIADATDAARATMLSFRGVPANSYGVASLTNYAPLIYREMNGWDTGIEVQNLSSITRALVRVQFMDNNGGIITTIEDQICPRGCLTFFLPAIADLPGLNVGAAKIESLVWWDPANPPAELPFILSVVNLTNYYAGQFISYNALPGQEAEGITSVALPTLKKYKQGPHDPSGTAWTSEIAIQNLNSNPGQTSVRIDIYDQNKLFRSTHQSLRALQVGYIDLSNIGDIPFDFSGSAIVSVEESNQSGIPSIGAVLVERAFGYPSGDLTRAYEGIPVHRGAQKLNSIYLPLVLKHVLKYGDTYEPNNSPAQAYGPLVSGLTYQSYIWTADDDDWYYIDVTALDPITIDLTVPVVADYDLYLYDSTGSNIVAKSDNYGNGINEHIEYTLKQTGKYYIRVYPYQGCSNVDPYLLTVTFGSP